MRHTRGLTLIELLIALGISSLIVVSIAGSYAAAIRFQDQSRSYLETREARMRLEQRLRELLQGAFVSSTATDTTTYMLGEATGDSITAEAADTLTFTTISESVNKAGLTQEDDFETSHEKVGPQGGVAEISLSTMPVGDTGQNVEGLFLREQRPGDGDPTQGGFESVLDPDVASIQFEFYNGTDWDLTWSTSGVNPAFAVGSGEHGRRIPAAIRVTYKLASEPEGTTHTFVVRLPLSDVTAASPIAIGEVTP